MISWSRLVLARKRPVVRRFARLNAAGLGRLLTIFEDLRQTSQLIVITHQKRTMEIADALYGVSMRQDGVSAVVGQRVAHDEAAS